MFKAPHGRLQGTEAPVCSVVLPVVWDTSGLGSLKHPLSQLQSGRQRESYGFRQHELGRWFLLANAKNAQINIRLYIMGVRKY